MCGRWRRCSRPASTSSKEHPLVGEVRGVGLIGALELVADKKTKRRLRSEEGGRRDLRQFPAGARRSSTAPWAIRWPSARRSSSRRRDQRDVRHDRAGARPDGRLGAARKPARRMIWDWITLDPRSRGITGNLLLCPLRAISISTVCRPCRDRAGARDRRRPVTVAPSIASTQVAGPEPCPLGRDCPARPPSPARPSADRAPAWRAMWRGTTVGWP